MTTSIADWLHARSWVILCSLWRGSKAERENKRARGIPAREYCIKGGKVFKGFKVVRDFKDLKDFSGFKRLRLCYIGSELFLIGCTGFKLQKPVEIACIKLVLNNAIFFPFALGTSLCQFSRYTTRIFQHISVHQ